jgi:hypothetical protein
MLSAAECMCPRQLVEVKSFEDNSSERPRPFYFETRM